MPLAGHGLRPTALRRWAGRPQLKRDPLGRTRTPVPNRIILDSTLFVRLDLGDTRPTNSAFRANIAAKAQLANALLLYDTVAVPTYDRGIVPILAEWFGHDCFLEALRADAFKFVRRRGLLAYVGNGNSISTILIQPGGKPSWAWWQDALFGLSQRSLELQVDNVLPLSTSEKTQLVDAAAPHILEHGYDNGFFLRNIVQESYEDILKVPKLRALVDREFAGQTIDLARLPNVSPTQVRVLTPKGIRDSVDLLLRVADVNMELFLAASTDFADLYTVGGAQELLGAKLARARVAPATVSGFTKLLTLNNLPDVGAAVSRGELEFRDVLTLRSHPDAVAFRRWLQTVPIIEADAVVGAYITALSSAARPQSWPVRTLRLALTTALGLANPAAGIAAGVADTYFVDRWRHGYSPRLFLDRVARLDLPNRS